MATADINRRHLYLVHAAEDLLCDWKPSARDLALTQQALHVSYVAESASCKHNYSHWLHCNLPQGRISLTDLKLSHPEVIPKRDRMAAPMRLASWIRFETLMASKDWGEAIGLLVSNLHKPDDELLGLLRQCVSEQDIKSMAEAQALLLKKFRVGNPDRSVSSRWLTNMARDLLGPIPFREVFVILALFLPQLTPVDSTRTQQFLWANPVVKQQGLEIDITPTAAGLQGMHEYHISFSNWSYIAMFCTEQLQHLGFEQLACRNSSEVRMGCQVGKGYRMVLQEGGRAYSVLAILLALTTRAKKKAQKGEEPPLERIRRQSSPRSWDVALVPYPADFAPLPTQSETGLACPLDWGFPPSLQVLTATPTRLLLVAIADVGDTVTADHLIQMATLPAEHKPTALGIPAHLPIPYQLECAGAVLQSLHALFGLLASGNTLTYCPHAVGFAKALGTAAHSDNGHIASLAASLALAIRSERSTLAVAGVFGAGKTRSFTFLLAWLALTTRLKIAVVHKENLAGRAITKLLSTSDLSDNHRQRFIRPVSVDEAAANTAQTAFGLPSGQAALFIPGSQVVIATTGLVWDQKGQSHSALNAHMENIDILIGEEAQQDMDLKSAFAPAVPRQPFFRAILGDPKQSPGGVADEQRAHRTLLLKAPIGLRAPHRWYMPHELAATRCIS